MNKGRDGEVQTICALALRTFPRLIHSDSRLMQCAHSGLQQFKWCPISANRLLAHSPPKSLNRNCSELRRSPLQSNVLTCTSHNSTAGTSSRIQRAHVIPLNLLSSPPALFYLYLIRASLQADADLRNSAEHFLHQIQFLGNGLALQPRGVNC
jgi:hypothetical protein